MTRNSVTPRKRKSAFSSRLWTSARSCVRMSSSRRAARRVIAGRTFDLRVTDGAVTDADIWLYDGASGVAVLGDLVTLPAPFFETACPAAWRMALDEVRALPFKTAIPGHGEPMNRGQFDTWRGAFNAYMDCVEPRLRSRPMRGRLGERHRIAHWRRRARAQDGAGAMRSTTSACCAKRRQERRLPRALTGCGFVRCLHFDCDHAATAGDRFPGVRPAFAEPQDLVRAEVVDCRSCRPAGSA